jgi:hypothetical protein
MSLSARRVGELRSEARKGVVALASHDRLSGVPVRRGTTWRINDLGAPLPTDLIVSFHDAGLTMR